jgi:UDP-N-acetylmuramoyl-tripeptide--D-alanyl-D-alanine ligase
MESNTQTAMPHMTLANIANACAGTYVGSVSAAGEEVTGIVTDSRQVQDGYLFAAVKGERVDGHDFIPQVFAQGAKAVLCEQEPQSADGPYILVDSTLEALKRIASFYRSVLELKVIGITGSVGKTSTKEMIASVLSQKYRVLKTAGNFNNELGLPLTIFRIQKEHEVAVLEMGISDFGEMHRLAAIANPDIGVITNIGWCHLENLKTRDGILKAKTEMFAHMKAGGIAILNGDDDKLCTQKEVNGAAPVFYGIPEKMEGKPESEYVENPAIYAENVENLGFEGMRADIHTPEGSFSAEISIPGEHNVYNALAATAVGLTLGLTLDEIQRGIASAGTIAGRTNFIRKNGMIIIDDCYNANPISMKSSIEVLSHAAGRSIAVLGDMGELGSDERALHYEVGTCVGEQKIDALFCAGVLAKEYKKAAEAANPDCEIFYFPTRDEMLSSLLGYVREGDTVLVKASHFMQFPEVVSALQKRPQPIQ